MAYHWVDIMGYILPLDLLGEDVFNMDFRFPFSPYQAFAICLEAQQGEMAGSEGAGE